MYSLSPGSEELDSRAPLRQSSPGPISLELFGMEETEDAPLELPIQATITVLPKPVLSSDRGNSTLSFTGTFALSLQSGTFI